MSLNIGGAQHIHHCEQCHTTDNGGTGGSNTGGSHEGGGISNKSAILEELMKMIMMLIQSLADDGEKSSGNQGSASHDHLGDSRTHGGKKGSDKGDSGKTSGSASHGGHNIGGYSSGGSTGPQGPS